MEYYIIALVLGLIILFLSFLLFDVCYFLTVIFLVTRAKLFRKKIKFLGTSAIYGIVLPSDADCWLTHMNNARVFREFDFGRFDHFQRSGYLTINYNAGVVAAQTCRYRRPLHMFMVYKTVTSIVYYDPKSVYFEQQIISRRDDIIRCTAYIKVAFSFNVEEMIEKYYPGTVKPPIPKDLQAWLNYNALSSEKLNFKKSSQRRSHAKLLQESEESKDSQILSTATDESD